MTVRVKLTMAAIAVIVVINSLVSLVGVEYAQRVWMDEVQSRVRWDLNSARADYRGHLEQISRFLQAVALDRSLSAAMAGDEGEQLGSLVDGVYRGEPMDFVNVLDASGRVLYRARSPGHRGDDLSANPIVAAAMKRRAPVTGTIILAADQLRTEGEDLAQRARFDLMPTPAARPTADETRTQGMVVAAAVPIVNREGVLQGMLYGGDLLNRRYEIVDSIKREVFGGQSFEGGEIGTVTIFQDDLRISTNVTTQSGTRAVGTRLSKAVYDEVLVRGHPWADRAFVVNDWYITAYEPIRDPAGKIIGALYVGLLEAPFIQKRNVLTGAFLAMVFVATVASLFLVFIVTRQVLLPITKIIGMSRKVVDGDLSARVDMRPSGEMGQLCEAINAMADAVAGREEQFKLVTRQQIGQSEKLASIGRLAAGVAHEINNPLTGVLTFAHLIKEEADLDEQGREDLNLIISETSRAAEIVRGLLDFARERPAVKEPLDLNDVIVRTLRLLRNQKVFQQVEIVEQLAGDLPRVDGDANQLQQVLLNLALNACEAMPHGGSLDVRTVADGSAVRVTVTDNGCGIKQGHLDQVFEPFFSTKPVGKGTGLGLSVSYGIVRQHGGTLEVESEEGGGTTFTIQLPGADAVSGADEQHRGEDG